MISSMFDLCTESLGRPIQQGLPRLALTLDQVFLALGPIAQQVVFAVSRRVRHDSVSVRGHVIDCRAGQGCQRHGIGADLLFLVSPFLGDGRREGVGGQL